MTNSVELTLSVIPTGVAPRAATHTRVIPTGVAPQAATQWRDLLFV